MVGTTTRWLPFDQQREGNSTEARLKADSVLPPISNSLGGSGCAETSSRERIAYQGAIYSDNIKWLQLFTVWRFHCSRVWPLTCFRPRLHPPLALLALPMGRGGGRGVLGSP